MNSPKEIVENVNVAYEHFKKVVDKHPHAFRMEYDPKQGYVLHVDLDYLEEKPIDEEFEKVKNRLLSIVDEFNEKLVSAANESPVPVKIRGLDMSSPYFDRAKKQEPVQVRVFNGDDSAAGYYFAGLT